MSHFDDLKTRAIELGIPTNSGIYKPSTEPWEQLQITEWELHRRIRDEERHIREHRLWVVAVGSAVVSVFSMVAAWVAVLTH